MYLWQTGWPQWPQVFFKTQTAFPNGEAVFFQKSLDIAVTAGGMLWEKEGAPMEYTVQALAKLAGVSPRTLRWYEHIWLLWR